MEEVENSLETHSSYSDMPLYAFSLFLPTIISQVSDLFFDIDHYLLTLYFSLVCLYLLQKYIANILY